MAEIFEPSPYFSPSPLNENLEFDIPEHLVFEILILLPVATLVRFKSACKSWNALISSSYFIANHLDYHRDEDILIGFNDPLLEESCLLQGKKYEMFSNFDCYSFVENPFSPERLSSDGIICIVNYFSQEVDLWNPAMKQVRRLPEPPVSYLSCNDHFINYGCGYSAESNDYKVVRIVVHKGNVNNNAVDIYSLKEDCWRSILKDDTLSFKLIRRPVSKNGICFWIGSDSTHDVAYRDDSVVSFDLKHESFLKMQLPGNASVFSSLDFLGDKLAFISVLEDPTENILESRYYEIWVLQKSDREESWSKIWKIGPTNITFDNYVYFPLGFSKNGDYLLLTDGDGSHGGPFCEGNHVYRESEINRLHAGPLHAGTVYLYNLGTQEINELRPLGKRFHLFARFMQSLISVKRLNDEY